MTGSDMWYSNFLDAIYGKCERYNGICYSDEYDLDYVISCSECGCYAPPSDYIGEIYYP